MHTRLIRIAMAVILLLCLLDMPYGYYQFVRFAGMVVFGYLAFLKYEAGQREWMIFWAASAVLINPIVKISLGREMWNVVDVVWAVVLLYEVYRDRGAARQAADEHGDAS